MRFISNLDHHTYERRRRFPQNLWPTAIDAKTVDEWWILLEFLQSVGHPLTQAPVKLSPPRPDFECIISEQTRLFEIGEILDSSLAEGIAHSGKQSHRKMLALSAGKIAEAAAIETAGQRGFIANGSLERILSKKLTKNYDCALKTCDLLLFFDLQTPYGPFEYILERREELASLIALSSFESVWLFHLPTASVMGRMRVAPEGDLQVVFDFEFGFDKKTPFECLVPGVGGQPNRIQLFEPVLSPIRSPKK